MAASLAPIVTERTDGFAGAWAIFRNRFMTQAGRIVDTGNDGVSHSEGQGFGLLFAVAADDHASFQRLLAWTNANLACRTDALHAWRYMPQGADRVPDTNNATDGDLLIATALARAGQRWGVSAYTRRAAEIARAVLDRLVVEVGGRVLLLPGAQGFQQANGIVLNPSYYVFVAFDELGQLVPSPLWARLRRDGMGLVEASCFGAWRLPADWVMLGRASGAVAPSPDHPGRFSYDAVRVPLYLAWARFAQGNASGGDTPGGVMQSCARYWARYGNAPPAWIDIRTGATAPYRATHGMIAVRQVTAGACAGADVTDMPAVTAATDYYSAALVMLSLLVLHDRAQGTAATGRTATSRAA